MRTIMMILFVLLTGQVWAQEFSGRVTDAMSGEPLAYVNIGVVAGGQGTVSDETGLFNINLVDVDDEAILRFSYIGYESVDFPLRDILPTSDPLLVELTPTTLEMKEVLVFPKEYREKVKGNPNPPRFIQAGFGEDSLGYEIGVLIKIRKRPTLLKTLTLHRLVTNYDSVFYRLNVYEMNGREPGRNLLKEQIYVDIGPDDMAPEISIDLTGYHIVVQDDFLITLEYVRELGEGSLVFGAGMGNGWTYYRKTSQDVWYRAPIGIGMSVLIRYAK